MILRRVCVVLPLLTLAACDDRALNPEHGPLAWTPQGINNANIAAQVANPADLAQGHGDAGSDGQQMAAAVHHWRTLAPPNFLPNAGSASGGSDTVGVSSGGTP